MTNQKSDHDIDSLRGQYMEDYPWASDSVWVW